MSQFFEFFGGILVEKRTGFYKKTHILLSNFISSSVISLQPTTVLDSLVTAKDHPERQAARRPTEHQPCSLAALLCPGSALRLASASQPHLISPKPTLAPCRGQELNKCQLLSLIIIMGATMNQPLTLLSDLTVQSWSYGLSGWAAD